MIGGTLGPYRIEAELGSGGMGTVYLATVTERVQGAAVGDRVALKVVHPHLLEQRGFFKRFMREADIGKTVVHENLVRTLDVDALVKDGTSFHFLAMEYVEGQTLRALLEELGRVPEELCRHIGKEVCKGLAAIHAKGIVHRDLKPDNALITQEHEVKVMDLGVARLADEVIRLSQTGAFVGSVLYAAPEQFHGGGEELDGRADLYALGLTLYELVTGQHPFADENLRVAMRKQLNEEPRRAAEINPQLSPFLEEVIHALLAKDKDGRFATADELHAVLDEAEDSAWWQARAVSIRAETHQPLRRIRVPRETALYGRDDELERLNAAFREAKAGHGQVLLIQGEAGIGKTRLVDEFVARLQHAGEDVNFLFGAYPPGGAATAAGAFSTAYREQFGSAGLTATLGEYLTECPLLVPAFAALLRGDPTPKDEETLTKDSIQTVFVHATRALGAERTTVVLIDDLQHAPEEGRALFISLALAIPDHRVVLIGSARPGLSEEWVADVERLEHAGRITLSRLPPVEFVNLLKDAFRSERLAEELGLRILTKSDGNPFFVFEILRGLKDGKYITQSDDGSWMSTQVINKIEIPSSVLDLIHARIKDLTEEEREILDVAACCGFEFDPGLVADAAGMRRVPALRALGRIEKTHRLIRSVGRKFAFDHHQVQEVLYEGQPEMLREEYHAALAEAIEGKEKARDRDPSELDGRVALDLCQHFFDGARPEDAVRYLDAALDHLEDGHLHNAAAELAGRALASERLVADAARVELLLRTATWYSRLGRVTDERAMLDPAAALADGLGGAVLRARVRLALGQSHLQGSTNEEAVSNLRLARELAQHASAREVEGQAERTLAFVLIRLGRKDEAYEHALRSLEIAREMDDRVAGASAERNFAIVLHFLGRLEESLTHFERALDLAVQGGSRREQVQVQGSLGNCTQSLGRMSESFQHYEAALEGSRQFGDRRSQQVTVCCVGINWAVLGEYARAREMLARALTMSREMNSRYIEGHTLHWLAVVRERCGETAAADADCAAALEIRRALGERADLAESLLLLAERRAAAGRPSEARVAAEEARRHATEAEHPGYSLLSAVRLACLPGGDQAAAREALERLEGGAEFEIKMTARMLLWRTTGDGSLLPEAHRLLQHLRDHAPEEYRDSMVENVPLYRDIAAAWAAHGQAAG